MANRSVQVALKRRLSLLLLIILSLTMSDAFADPLNGSLQSGTSISNAYDSRSVFSNPAALGFQTELNGTHLSSAYTWGIERTQQDDYAFALALGYFGFSAEALSQAGQRASRFGFALGFPLTNTIFVGGRYSLFRTDSAGLNPYDGLDLGVQFRPSPYWSAGFLTNRVNHPLSGPTRLPLQYVLGTTVRPIDRVELSVDVDTTSDNNWKRYGYQAAVSVEPVHGVFLKAGYHSDYRWQFGFQVNVGILAFSSWFQPGAESRSALMGIESATSVFQSALPAPVALKLDVDKSLAEEGANPGLFSKGRPSLLEYLEQLRIAETEPAIRTVLVDLDSFPLGLAAAEELAEALWRVRSGGKKVEVYLGQAGIKEYLIASAADRIVLASAGELKFPGLRAEHYFVKGTMDKPGIEGEFLARGEYKSAPEMFTRKESSKPNREATFDMLSEASKEIYQLVNRYRKIDVGTWKELEKLVLLSSKEAMARHMVDSLGDAASEIKAHKQSYQVEDGVTPYHDSLMLPPRIAVIIADGNIMQKKLRVLGLAGQSQLTPDKMEKALRAAMRDGRTKAIVLRVSSPGGEVLASEQLANLVESAREEKPVVISMGDVAASGGYYLAAPGNRIFADRLTITGSIGVFLGKFNLSELFKKIDLRKEILSEAPFAGIDSEDKPWTPAERAIMVRRLDEYYGDFVSYVALKRKMEFSETDRVARGRVWLGSQALKNKLIDETGGLYKAIEYAATLGGVEPTRISVWELRERGGLLEMLGADEVMEDSKAAAQLPFTLFGSSVLRDLLWIASVREHPILYWSPVTAIK